MGGGKPRILFRPATSTLTPEDAAKLRRSLPDLIDDAAFFEPERAMALAVNRAAGTGKRQADADAAATASAKYAH